MIMTLSITGGALFVLHSDSVLIVLPVCPSLQWKS